MRNDRTVLHCFQARRCETREAENISLKLYVRWRRNLRPVIVRFETPGERQMSPKIEKTQVMREECARRQDNRNILIIQPYKSSIIRK